MASSVATAAARPASPLLAKRGLLVAAALSLGAGLVHLQFTPSSMYVWWGYGLFFLLTGVGQLAYAGALVRWPNPAVLWIGIAGNLGVVGLYMVTRTNGIPTGPMAGHIESVGQGDFMTTAGEFVMVGMLAAALGPRSRSWLMTAAALGGVALWILRYTDRLL
jgi:hypothetical protein